MYMNALSKYVCIPYVPGTCGGQKKAQDLLDLELQTAVCCHVGTGNQTQVSLDEEPGLLIPEPSFQPQSNNLSERDFLVMVSDSNWALGYTVLGMMWLNMKQFQK